MFLKRIEVKGFKSFADKVELELDKGITGVVGPNGSGKSNISDAVRWVLGEQSAKSLRGGKMEDVIFAGTDMRKPLGFAEVSITIDNSDNLMPIDYSEVTITRRMYRSGESEYFINRANCRLKDITELFMDTGVGRDGYSIVGQGRIDEILNAKPEDRREMFEEAAGIVKYKSRKQESERKLDTTEQNIVRIEDIINELQMQLDPLSEQSSNAKKFLDFREQLKTLEINIYIRNIDKIKEKLSNIDEYYSSLERELIENSRNSSKIEEEYTSLKISLHEMDRQIESMQTTIYSSNNEIEKLQGEINVLNEKALNIGKNTFRLDNEIEKEKQDIEKLSNSLKECKDSLLNADDLLKSQLLMLDGKNSEFDSINNKISKKEEYIENLKSEVIELLNLIADKKSLINSYISFINNIDKRRNQIKSEKTNKNNTMNDLNSNLIKLEQDIDVHKSDYNTALNKVSSLEDEKSNIIKQKKTVENNIFELNEKIQTKQARYKMLHEMETEFEGYNKSVKEIMKLKNNTRRTIPGICGVIADLIHVPEEYETAMEVALGSALQNIVTEDELAAKKCIEFLKVNKYGRATFLPLTTIKGRESVYNEKSIRKGKGFIGFGNELISFENRYANIISSLLGRVAVVDVLDNGINIAKSTNYSMKIVTLDGDIINPGGAFTGGSISQKTGKILSRKREIDQLAKDLKVLEGLLSSANEDKMNIEMTIGELEREIKITTEHKHSLEIMLSSCNNKITQIKGDMDRIESENKILDTELLQLEMEYNESIVKMEEESFTLKELEKRNISISDSVQTEQSSVKDTLSYKEELISQITSIKVKVAEFRQEISSYRNRIDEFNNSIMECNLIIENKKNEKMNSTEEQNKIKENIKLIETTMDSITSSNVERKTELDRVLNDKKENSVIMEDMEQKKKQFGENASTLQNEIHKLDMQKAKMELELEGLQNKIWDDYEISYAAALKYKMEIDNITQASKDISVLKEEIKQLGPVNIGAIDEYKRVKERYEFLSKQKSDLEEAKNSLKQVIVEMTEKMKNQFIKNFAIIKENFIITFQQLFGGGKAELILCNEENILESGVEIVAQPPGKRLQNLTLLSGGEKALTAIALLFAILKMKPSPFCILDEIEAALDDVNVARYSRFLKEFSRQTQFIIVTHRKGTMEVADVLYGVTMEEKGVSRIVSIKLEEKAS